MSLPPTEVWVPIVTLILGYASSLVTEAQRDKRASTREREAREAEREEVRNALERERRDRHVRFQQETLLELQEVLHKLMRTYGEEHHQDVMTSRRAGEWRQFQLGGDISDRGFQATQRINILSARVDDGQVRLLVTAMEESGNRLMLAQSEAESSALLSESGEAFNQVNLRIGELLRDLD